MTGCVKPKQRYLIKESSHVTYSQRTDQNNGRHHTTGKAFRCTPFSVTRKKHLQRAAGVGDRRHNCAKLKQKSFKTSQDICPKFTHINSPQFIPKCECAFWIISSFFFSSTFNANYELSKERSLFKVAPRSRSFFSIVVSQDCWRQLRKVHGMHCQLICQRIFGTVGDRQEGRDLNEKRLGADNGRQQSSKEVSRVRVWCKQEYRKVTVSVSQK